MYWHFNSRRIAVWNCNCQHHRTKFYFGFWCLNKVIIIISAVIMNRTAFLAAWIFVWVGQIVALLYASNLFVVTFEITTEHSGSVITGSLSNIGQLQLNWMGDICWTRHEVRTTRYWVRCWMIYCVGSGSYNFMEIPTLVYRNTRPICWAGKSPDFKACFKKLYNSIIGPENHTH